MAQGAGKFLKKGGVEMPGAQAPEETEEDKKNKIFSPGGLVMLTIGVLLDFLSIVCAVLIIAFGIGLVLAKIVYFVGLVITSLWALSQGGALPTKKGGKMTSPLTRFFKNQWKNKEQNRWPRQCQ